ncbi:helix-turn-helix domain-containing protein [Haladaptatus sp.]|uniref:helix-turn-helix domain-containing protein n=1 Tax=Haladaptatus sp. TaxID=1973141 RepID=UPI003C62AAD2
MSQSQNVVGAVETFEQSPKQRTVVENEDAVRDLLTVLNTSDCQAILDVTSNEALSASEISNRCELPLSTTYRKLNLLADDGLLEERVRISGAGKHVSEYARIVEDVVISMSPEGTFELHISQHEGPKSHTGFGFGMED